MELTGEETPLSRYKLAETSDVGEFEEAVRPIFGDVRFDRANPLNEFRARANYRLLDQSGIYYGHYGTRVKISIPYARFIAQGVTLEGSGTHSVNGVERTLNNSELPNAVLNSSRVNLDFSNTHRHLAFCMKPQVVQQKLSTLTGIASDKKFFMDEDAAMSAAELRRFRRLLLLLVTELEDSSSPPSKVFLRELEQALMVAFLVGYQHDFSQLFEARPNDIAPWQVKRVEQFIEAHWDQPLDIESIAAAVDASIRSIQMSFRTSRGYSPMEFARKVRLQHARRMLSNPVPGTSVTNVAYACCFGNLGHFSRFYFDEFRELPSATLARAKGNPNI